MTPEAIMTLIRLSLKRCPGCGYDVSNAHTPICPECGRDLTHDAIWVGRTQPVDRESWIKVFALVICPAMMLVWWLAVEESEERKYNPDAPAASGGVLVFVAIVAAMIVAGGLMTRRR